jgi:hypothetical protein
MEHAAAMFGVKREWRVSFGLQGGECRFIKMLVSFYQTSQLLISQ